MTGDVKPPPSPRDGEGHSRDLMRCARSPLALLRCSIDEAPMQQHSRRSIDAATLTQPHCFVAHTPQYWCRRSALPSHSRPSIYAALMQQHSRSSTDASALTQKHCFAALSPPHWCRCSHAAKSMPPLVTTPHSRCSIHHLCSSIYATALTLQRSHNSIVQHLAAFFGRSIHTDVLMRPHFCRHIYAAARAPPHLHCSARAGALQVDDNHLERIFKC